MTGVRYNVDPPEEFARIGVNTTGMWVLFTSGAGRAYVYWHGGPKSPDRIALLHDIEVSPKGMGHGSELLRDICLWADSRRLTIKLVCDPRFMDWYVRNGFQALGLYMDVVEMRRLPGLLIPT